MACISPNGLLSMLFRKNVPIVCFINENNYLKEMVLLLLELAKIEDDLTHSQKVVYGVLHCLYIINAQYI